MSDLYGPKYDRGYLDGMQEMIDWCCERYPDMYNDAMKHFWKVEEEFVKAQEDLRD